MAATDAEHLGWFTTTSGTPGPPSKPSGIEASEVAANSAVITWDPSEDPNGDAVTYMVRYRINGTSGWGALYETTETSYTLTGLQAGADYDIRLMASDGKLKSARNFTNLFTTTTSANQPPAAPTGVVASSVTSEVEIRSRNTLAEGLLLRRGVYHQKTSPTITMSILTLNSSAC